MAKRLVSSTEPDNTWLERRCETSVDLLATFFSRKRIQNTLAGIWDTEATGWEKWWQIELAMFLSDHEDIAGWNMEEEFHTDLRTSTSKDFMAIDICFRRKGFAANHFVFLELTQDRDWKRCIGNMLRDAEKFGAGKTRSIGGKQVRSFWLVGVHPGDSKAEVHDYIESVASRRDVDWRAMKTRFIAGTPYAFTVV
jgi:hypothetical protein